MAQIIWREDRELREPIFDFLAYLGQGFENEENSNDGPSAAPADIAIVVADLTHFAAAPIDIAVVAADLPHSDQQLNRTESDECRAFCKIYQNQQSTYKDIQNGIDYLDEMEVYFRELSTFKFLNNKDKGFIERNIKAILEMSEKWTNTLHSLHMDKCNVTPLCTNMPTSVAVPCGHHFCCKQCRLQYFQTMAEINNGANQCMICFNNCDIKVYNL